jgi:hypothetical protein
MSSVRRADRGEAKSFGRKLDSQYLGDLAAIRKPRVGPVAFVTRKVWLFGPEGPM